jgi:hypothetical protein
VRPFWGTKKVEDAAHKRKQVLDMLVEIRDQRAKLSLKIDFGGGATTSIEDITAVLTESDVAGLTVEVSALKGVSSAWVGAGVSCFFCLRDRGSRGGEQLFTFTSRINAVQLRPSGTVQFVLALPETIKSGQRRRFVRVAGDQRKVPVFRCWRELPSGIVISAPPLLSSESNAKQGLQVGNISANGMRLLLEDGLVHRALPKQDKGERFTFYFTAVVEPATPAMSFWVNAVLRNIFSNSYKREVSLGFEFIAEGVLDEERRIFWHPLKSSEVSSLGKIIFKWNLDLSREKG